jgi:hypothetical protein
MGSEMIESREQFLELIKVSVGNYCKKLMEDGLQRFLDRSN